MAHSIRAMQTDQATSILTHGMAMGTTVMTLDGDLPVEYLTPGDRMARMRWSRCTV